MEKTCNNCIHKESYMFCEPYCIDYSSHEFTCEYCKHKFIDNILFCDMDEGDDGMSCCGDKFELDIKWT